MRRAFVALVYSGLALAAMVAGPHGPALAAEADTSVAPAEEPPTAPTPAGGEPAEPPEEPAAVDDGSGTSGAPGDLPAAGDVPAAAAEEPDEAPAASRGIVRVMVRGARNQERRSRSGFVVQPGYVVTAAHLVEDEDLVSVLAPSDAGMAELVADVRDVEVHADLALLLVGGLDLEPLVLAKDGFGVGRNVISIGFWGRTDPDPVSSTSSLSAAESAGVVIEQPVLERTRVDAAVDLLRHSAMIPAAGYGGPLLNDCGEVVGVNRSSRGMYRRARRGDPPQDAVEAARVSAIVGLLQQNGVTFTRTESSCLDPELVARAEAERDAEESRRAAEDARRVAEEAQGKKAEAEAEAEAAQADLDQAREDLEARDAEVADLESRVAEARDAGAENVESLEAELEEARANRDAVQRNVEGLERQVDGLRDQVVDLESEVAMWRQNLVVTIAIAVAAVLLLTVVAVVLYRRRSLELAHVRQQVGAGQRHAPMGARAGEASGASGPDYLLTGETGNGTPVSLKVLGSMVSSSVVIGRSPRNATLLIDDKTLSRAHARLFEGSDGALHVEDLGTTNGTRVNGRQLQPRRGELLRRGDTVQLGEVTLRLV